jgi:hypothetical protein
MVWNYMFYIAIMKSNTGFAKLSICECFNRLMGSTRDPLIVITVSQSSLHMKIVERNNDATYSDTLALRQRQKWWEEGQRNFQSS